MQRWRAADKELTSLSTGSRKEGCDAISSPSQWPLLCTKQLTPTGQYTHRNIPLYGMFLWVYCQLGTIVNAFSLLFVMLWMNRRPLWTKPMSRHYVEFLKRKGSMSTAV